ncbi:MAG: hypothetical protein HQM10_01840 [Candidatus Riflebacteria bacterium]|nr:hypothetical protein [Candidatus Riflebacteria bacterium]
MSTERIDFFKAKDHHVPVYRFFPLTEGLISSIAMVGFLSIGIWFIYWGACDAVEGEIKEGLLRLTSAVALTIDGEKHKNFKSSASKNDPDYLEMTANLERIRQAATHVRYLYTNIMIDDKVYFIINGSPQNDNDGDGRPDDAPNLMTPYPDASPSLIKALKDNVPVVDDKPYTDIWGTFISAYVPFHDSKGKIVGTLGMDLELIGLKERLAPVKTYTKRLLIMTVVFAILFGASMWFNRRFASKLQGFRGSMLEDFKRAVTYASSIQKKENTYFKAIAKLYNADTSEKKKLFSENFPRMFKFFEFLNEYANFEGKTGKASDEADQGKSKVENFVFRDFINNIHKKLTEGLVNRDVKIAFNVSEDLPTKLSADWEMYSNILFLALSKIIRQNPLKEWVFNVTSPDEQINTIDVSLNFDIPGYAKAFESIHLVLENIMDSEISDLTGDPSDALTLKHFNELGIVWNKTYEKDVSKCMIKINFNKHIEEKLG